MIPKYISGKSTGSRRRARKMSGIAVAISALLCTTPPPRLSSADAPDPNAAGAANVLDGIEKKILKEPKYDASPRYALLVFGAKADSHVWLVEDGKTLYVDKNANGDLTDDGPPLVPTNVRGGFGKDGNGFQFDYVLDEITPAGVPKHTDFCLHRWNYGEKADSYGLLATLSGTIPMFAGWFGTFWASSPKDVPIVHFGGPMQPKLLRFREVGLEPKTQRLSVGFTNPGGGEGATSRLSIYALPEKVMPVVEIDWPVKEGAPPLRTSYTLSERCCYWEFYDPDFKVPAGIVGGTAKATISLPDGAFPLELTTHQIEFPVRENVPSPTGQ